MIRVYAGISLLFSVPPCSLSACTSRQGSGVRQYGGTMSYKEQEPVQILDSRDPWTMNRSI